MQMKEKRLDLQQQKKQEIYEKLAGKYFYIVGAGTYNLLNV